MNKKLLDQINKGNVSYFYTSRTWRSKRLEILERDGNECQLCKRNGRVTVGVKGKPLIVHHIQELRHRPELALTDDNLLTVCNDCHETVCHGDRLKDWRGENKFTNEERW